jgi:hypothetical protein
MPNDHCYAIPSGLASLDFDTCECPASPFLRLASLAFMHLALDIDGLRPPERNTTYFREVGRALAATKILIHVTCLRRNGRRIEESLIAMHRIDTIGQK